MSTGENQKEMTLDEFVARLPDHAAVYWRAGTEWGSAEPRPATDAEVLHVTRSVLDDWQWRDRCE